MTVGGSSYLFLITDAEKGKLQVVASSLPEAFAKLGRKIRLATAIESYSLAMAGTDEASAPAD